MPRRQRAAITLQRGSGCEQRRSHNLGAMRRTRRNRTSAWTEHDLHLIRFWKEYGIAIPSLAERSEALPCIGREHPCLSKEADKEFITLSVR
jgi:hypothetical protein